MIGDSVPRREDDRLVRGMGQYVEDLQLPGMLHVAFVRSSHASAEIRRVDREFAMSLPGVVSVFVGDDFPEFSSIMPAMTGTSTGNTPYCDFHDSAPHTLFSKTVTYVGEQIAVVIAETPYSAADGVEAVEVEYKSLPAVSSLEAAMQPDAHRVHPRFKNVVAHLAVEVGNTARAVESADLVIEDRQEMQSLKSMAIECRACAAFWDRATSTLNIWSTNQLPYQVRDTVARILNLPIESVRVMSRDIGGGFGLKGILYAEDLIVPILAYKLKKPMRWTETRMEHMASSNQSGEQIHEVRVAASAEGMIQSLEVKIYKNIGAYNHFHIMLPTNTVNHITTQYKVPNFKAEAWAVSTNTSPGSPYRGAGRVEASFTMDRALDAIARKTGLDPLEVRFRNIIRSADLPYRNGLTYRDGVAISYADVDFSRMLEMAADKSDYWGWRKRQAQLRKEGRSVGIGISSYVEAGGFGPCEGATVRIDTAGRVRTAVGVNSQGQGHETTLAQICSASLGARFEDIQVFGGDTSLQNFGFGTGASRVAVNSGNAVSMAALEVKRKIGILAATVLNCDPAEVDVADSIVFVKGARQNFIGLADLASHAARSPIMAELGGPGLTATRYFYPRTVTWSSGVNIAVIDLDRETGRLEVLKYVYVHDCGVPINPKVVEGQIYGGFAQGMGIALGEEAIYDDDGQVLTGTLMDYFVPRVSDVPHIEIDHIVIPTSENVLGIKSVGESGPNSPPAAIAAAVEDALDGAVRISKLPVSMHAILEAVRCSNVTRE
jgi:aerobic carbon-monoxide dehydrogenase large subunit